MEVQVRNALLCVRSAVDDAAKPAIPNAFLLRHACHDTRQPPEQGLILLGGVGETSHVLARDNQYVDGRLRIDVAEADRVVILVDDLRRNVPARDTAEETVDHGSVYPRKDVAPACARSTCQQAAKVVADLEP
jgi:hypothetical protein